MKVTDRDLPEIRVVMVWDESQCVEEVDIQRLLIAVVDQWTTDEGEIHPHLDSMRIEAEELPVGGEPEVSVAGSIGSLSSDVFERRTSTGSEVFSLLTYLDDIKFVFLSFFTVIEAI